MKKLKLVSMLALVVITSLVLVACGDNGNEDTEMKNQAKETYLTTVLKIKNPEATIDDVTFMSFLGIYNGSLVAIFYGGKYHGLFFDRVIGLEIEGLDFSYSDGYPILVWNNDKIHSLAEAYEQELLTKANLEAIYSLYRHLG